MASLFSYQHVYSHNSTMLSTIIPTALHAPFYHTTRPNLLPFMSDKHLSLAAPVLAYWLYSFFFHFLDTAQFSYFEKRRIHDSPEVLARNKVTVTQVIKAVILQHVIQTVLGIFWLEDDEAIFRREVMKDHLAAMSNLSPWVADGVLLVLGRRVGEQVLKRNGEAIVRWMYWWGIPALQMLLAFFVIDTWQYFWHRSMHTNHWLYRNFHSHHHRLYTPYAFGALYNHPVEGFILDTLGAAIAEEVSFMTIRQATLLFTVSTLKTVDDHCGYRLWWDPCQLFFANNADYHDIHHQGYGIKSNFSQPFFTNWDKLLGTRMTREEANSKGRWKGVGDEHILEQGPAKKLD
ncbi:C4-hydroxylase [Cryptococcus gattii E566]|uniref:Sphinganine C4-hydroxylase, putative n=2 Tax=Cryptococcus gattii TaxID=37769 RepID=E6QZK4_CRYGW|nr:Sphinganine C4-hydroxylase, putative [Cryptococcus gattii WM276]ADV19533.1 Sphinganine C4-hydroxylase, putative [Cryptococcus gattii WM276]KIR79861.1 C4-hydroxylase [Cryptococcus gattii EJB2]KIY34237.1 C4-hydroxylase [Cryptococcus gattii E566]KJE00956.1 C4-hydroxylase [Cryptococcus gattii NT-10]